MSTINNLRLRTCCFIVVFFAYFSEKSELFVCFERNFLSQKLVDPIRYGFGNHKKKGEI